MPRFNYTGRKKIFRQNIAITINNNNGNLSFNADIDLEKYKLHEDTPVFVEAYRQTSWMRFEFGTAGQIKEPPDTNLTEFDSLDGIKFRVKVSDVRDGHGKLLAIADRIQPSKPEDGNDARICILPIKSEDMDCIWKVDFSDDEPILLVNRKAGGRDELGQSQEFKSLVYPAVLREILLFIVDNPPDEIGEPSDDMQDSDKYKNQWIHFVSSLPGISECPTFLEEQELESRRELCKNWIEDVVNAFSKSQSVVENFVTYLENRS